MGREELIDAIKAGDTSKVREILKDTGIRSEDTLKGHLVFIAIEEDQADVVRILCEEGLSLGIVRSDDLMPIHVAAKYGNVQIIETLLRAGAGVNDVTPMHHMTPLTMATRWKQTDAVLHLLDAGADPNTSSGHYRQLTTPLHEASRIGHEQIVNLLLAASAEVNVLNGLHQLPLHVIAGSQTSCEGSERTRVVKRLIDCGSEVNVASWSGDLPLHTALSAAVSGDDVQVVRKLCVVGAHVNGYNGRGLTPLHIAVKHAVKYNSCPASIDSIQALLGFGALINRASMDAVLPIQMALVGDSRKYKGLLDILISAGSNIQHVNDQGMSILHCCAMSEGGASDIHYLLQHNVIYDTVSHKGESALTLACKLGHKANVIALVQGCPGLLDARSTIPNFCSRPLYNLLKLGDVSLVEFLLAGGYRWTPEELAEIAGKSDVSRELGAYARRLLEAPPVESLSNRCRVIIRMSLHSDVERKISSLPLPTSLKDFIFLKDCLPIERS